MKKILYKVLNKGMKSPYQDFVYELGKEYYCKDFDTDKSEDCSRGFYATDIEGLPFVFRVGREVYRCEVWGKAVEYNQYKRRYSRLRLIERVPDDEIKRMAKALEEEIGYKLSEVLFPYNSLKKKMKPTQQDIANVKEWASVWTSVWDSVGASVEASVGASVGDSVGASVGASVGDSVWTSVEASVGDSVWDSVWTSVGAYISGLFPNIKKWEHIEHEEGINPFQPAIDLWYRNLVPSFDGKTWRLHSGKNADVVWEGGAG